MTVRTRCSAAVVTIFAVDVIGCGDAGLLLCDGNPVSCRHDFLSRRTLSEFNDGAYFMVQRISQIPARINNERRENFCS
jgi:hypothetical protein